MYSSYKTPEGVAKRVRQDAICPVNHCTYREIHCYEYPINGLNLNTLFLDDSGEDWTPVTMSGKEYWGHFGKKRKRKV